MVIRYIVRTQEVTLRCKEFIKVILTGTKVYVKNRDARNGDDGKVISLHQDINCSSSKNRLVQGDLDIEGDLSPGVDDQWQGQHRDMVQGEDILSSSFCN